MGIKIRDTPDWKEELLWDLLQIGVGFFVEHINEQYEARILFEQKIEQLRQTPKDNDDAATPPSAITCSTASKNSSSSPPRSSGLRLRGHGPSPPVLFSGRAAAEMPAARLPRPAQVGENVQEEQKGAAMTTVIASTCSGPDPRENKVVSKRSHPNPIASIACAPIINVKVAKRFRENYAFEGARDRSGEFSRSEPSWVDEGSDPQSSSASLDEDMHEATNKRSREEANAPPSLGLLFSSEPSRCRRREIAASFTARVWRASETTAWEAPETPHTSASSKAAP